MFCRSILNTRVSKIDEFTKLDAIFQSSSDFEENKTLKSVIIKFILMIIQMAHLFFKGEPFESVACHELKGIKSQYFYILINILH